VALGPAHWTDQESLRQQNVCAQQIYCGVHVAFNSNASRPLRGPHSQGTLARPRDPDLREKGRNSAQNGFSLYIDLMICRSANLPSLKQSSLSESGFLGRSQTR
jgi:hypothetical protein